jgi:peptidyl-tRNA hydrolase
MIQAFPKPQRREKKRRWLERSSSLQTSTRINASREKERRGPPRDRSYLDLVKALCRCEARGLGTPCWGPFDPCHTGGSAAGAGAGMKSSDYSAICMCRGHHNEFDQRAKDGAFAGWTDEQRDLWAAPRVWATQERIGVRSFLDVLGIAVTFRACRFSARPVEESPSDPICHYVVVRRDLPSPGAIAAQVVHAAGESSPGNLGPETFAVVLAVEDESELLALDARLAAQGVAKRAIREPDMGNSMTAIGLVPGPKSQVGRWVSSIPLYR